MDQAALRKYFEVDLEWGKATYQGNLVFDFLSAAAQHAQGGIVLDAGAGRQRYKPFFADCMYVAQEHPVAGAEMQGLKEFDILCDVRHIPLLDNCVDAILSTSTLEHFEYPEEFFAESFRVLKPGGALFINVPFVYREHQIPYDFQRPTRYGVARWYKHAGFSSMTVRPTSSSIYTAAYFLQDAVQEELHRLKRRSFRALLSKFMVVATNLCCKAALKLYDRGPFESTQFPVGWIATGLKPGAFEKHVWPSKEAFLSACRTE
jgi:SAM-dependent methyltransferase